MDNTYEQISKLRRQQQESGDLPNWFSTAGLQIWMGKYQWCSTYKEQIQVISKTLARHTNNAVLWEAKFFDAIWKGWLSPSTPILANCGTDRGLVVSCSGSYVEDSIYGFYTTQREIALLTKHGFGTSAYLGDVRPRGSRIATTESLASGTLPVIKEIITVARNVSQGNTRRGSVACYLPIEHGDFWEVIHHLEREPDDFNMGWNISDDFVRRLSTDRECQKRFSYALKVKMLTGKGYFLFPDKINRQLPKYYKEHEQTFKASNLCTEICLPSDATHTYTCVLASLNLIHYYDWKDSDVVSTITMFLDCVCSDFLEKARGVRGLENAVRFTEKARAIGIGVMGWHTLLQKKMIPFESLEAHMLNLSIFKQIREQADDATRKIGMEYGCPEWGDGSVRNCSLLAVAPTKSTSVIMGGVSEGINPDPAMCYLQATAGGEVERINPILLQLMKDKDVYNEKNISQVIENFGSVRKVKWLTEDEKKVFKTAFEINQDWVVHLASQRGKYLDQWQSVNLFFSGKESAKKIADVHKKAFLDENIRGLYYIYSNANVGASKDEECLACQ